MAIFNSYVSLPEGNQHSPTNQHRPTTNLPGGSSRTATWTSESRMSRNGSDDARRVLGGPGSQRFNAGGGERDEEKKMCVENPLTFWHILTLKIKLNENQEKWWKTKYPKSGLWPFWTWICRKWDFRQLNHKTYPKYEPVLDCVVVASILLYVVFWCLILSESSRLQ